MSKQPTKKKAERKGKGKAVKASQLKVLKTIYSVTDCCNGVYQHATLHWTQRRIADSIPALVNRTEGVVSVDGDGFVLTPERWGVGYRLTCFGYATLFDSDPDRFPIPAPKITPLP